jgi:AraC family transcriptional regulator, glycine betaine-responsive activator
MSKNNALRIGFLLLDNYSMIAFANMVEVLRMVNYVTGENLYQWNITGLVGHHSCASNGLQIQHTCVLSHMLNMDIVFICGGFQLYKEVTPSLKNFLYRLDQRKIGLGGLCTGAYVLAKAELLDGFRASMHWENTLVAQEEFPLVQFNPHIFTIDRNRFTCSGGLAAIDLALQLVKIHYPNVTKKVCEQFIVHQIRESDDLQHQPLSQHRKKLDLKIQNVLCLMENNINEPLTINEIAQHIQLPTRTLERIFQLHLHQTPKEYYLKLRLTHAQNLLKQSSMTISNIALACGFSNASSFTKAYKAYFSYSPKTERNVLDFAS